MASYHSTFTPSQSDGQTLESLFVARQHIVAQVLAAVRESALTASKQQLLLIGSRGIGKTHLVALVNHRLSGDAELKDKLWIAWLSEDPYVATYTDLLLEILRRLGKEYPLAGLAERLDRALDLDKANIADVLEDLLRRALGDRTLLLIAENLDDLLDVIGDSGQKKLRALIQNERNISVLATTTSLSNAVTDRKKVFFGFFKTIHVAPLTPSEAEDMLARLAEHVGDKDLVVAIRSPIGRARIRAVHYLAGGNPRVYALFFDFLSRDSLEDLVGPFMKLIDELTSYYQARMSRLAPLQRRVIDILRQRRGATSVTEIARLAMNTSQTISNQLGKLRDLGYVTPTTVGRSSYYELREPMMRLCLEVKEMRGRSVELFVEFLRVWYAPAQLKAMSGSASNEFERNHFNEAAERSRDQQDRVMVELLADVTLAVDGGKLTAAIELLEAAIARDASLDYLWNREDDLLLRLQRSNEERLALWTRATETNPNCVWAWFKHANLLWQMQRYEEALESSGRALALSPRDNAALTLHSNILEALGRHEDTKPFFERVLETSSTPNTRGQWLDRARTLAWLDRYDEAVEAYLVLLGRDPFEATCWDEMLSSLREAGRLSTAVQVAERFVELFPDQAPAAHNAALAAGQRGNIQAALEAEQRAVALDPVAAAKYGVSAFNCALWLGDLGRHQAALDALDQLPPVEEDAAAYEFQRQLARADALMWLDRWEEGVALLDETLSKVPTRGWLFGLVPLLNLLRRSHSPDVWARFISAWLPVFSRHKALPQLGKELVWRIRTVCSLLTPETGRNWYRTWETLAAPYEELALPQRLLKAAVEFKASLDQRVLLELSLEERGLLSPWLGNLAREEPDQFDTHLLRSVEDCARVVSRRQRNDRAAALLASADESPTVDYARIFSGYSEAPATPCLRPLLPDGWQTLLRDEAEASLRRLVETNPTAARLLGRPGVSVAQVRQRVVTFSSWRLVQIDVRDNGRVGALDALLDQIGGRILDGRSSVVYDLVDEKVIDVSPLKARAEYVRFFSSMLRADSGRFEIIDALPKLAMGDPLAENLMGKLEPWRALPAGRKADPRFKGTVLYGSTISIATFGLHKGGRVDMVDDQTLANLAPFADEEFFGPLRLVPVD